MRQPTREWLSKLALMFAACQCACANTSMGGAGASDVPVVDHADSTMIETPEAGALPDVGDASVPNINCPVGYAYWYKPGGVHLDRVILCSEWEGAPVVCCRATHILPQFIDHPYYEASWPVRCVWITHCQDGGVVGRPPW